MGDWTFDLRAQGTVRGGSLALERGIGTLAFTPGPNAPAEMTSWKGKAHYLAVWRLEDDGKWRIMWDAPSEVGLV